MNTDGVLRCLAEAGSGELREESRGGRYAVLVYDGGSTRLRRPARASSVHGALDRLAEALAAGVDGGALRDFLAEEGEVPELRGIRGNERRLLGMSVLGRTGPMDIVTADHWKDAYLGDAPVLFPGARFVFLASAAPPHQDVAFAVLELQPTGRASSAGRALMTAQDAAAVTAALAAGADVDALDGRGMSALHHAVANRRSEAVTALLAAGADPAAQAGFGNAPHFAALRGRTVQAGADRIEDDGHWRILCALVEAGGPVNAGNRSGATLLDLAIATRPYPEAAIAFLRRHHARPAHRAAHPLTRLLSPLPYGSAARLAVRVNEVRFLLDSGAGTDGAFHALLGTYGYYDHEVPGDVLADLVDELLRHGARDTPDSSGRTGADMAGSWLAGGNHPHYEPVVRRLRAHHAAR